MLLNRAPSGLLVGKRALDGENARLRAALDSIGAVEHAQIQADLIRLREERDAVNRELLAARSDLVAVREEQILQEIGIYEYSHPLDSAVAYKDRLEQLRERYKAMARNKQAVVGVTNWQVNGSTAEGNRMVADFSKLMLRAYNNEADNAVRTMKPHRRDAAVDRLEKARDTISRLGRTMSIQVTPHYHAARVEELRLTADHLQKLQEEKEAERAERERLREEAKARQEFERERARLTKEASHYALSLIHI